MCMRAAVTNRISLVVGEEAAIHYWEQEESDSVDLYRRLGDRSIVRDFIDVKKRLRENAPNPSLWTY